MALEQSLLLATDPSVKVGGFVGGRERVFEAGCQLCCELHSFPGCIGRHEYRQQVFWGWGSRGGGL
jgi:hypothetical protein